MEWMREVGQLVRRQRKRLGISTQADLAKLANLGTESVSRVERGLNTTTDTLEAIALALKLDVRMLALGVRGQFILARDRPSVLSDADQQLWLSADEAHRKLARAALRISQPHRVAEEMAREPDARVEFFDPEIAFAPPPSLKTRAKKKRS